MKKKQKNKLLLRDVVAQGSAKSRRMKNGDGFLFPKAMLVPRVCPPKTGAFPEHEHCSGVLVLSKRKVMKGACTVKQAARG